MGSARLAAYRDGKGYPSASLATLDLIEPLIVLQLLIIPFLNLACVEKKGPMWSGRPARASSVLSLAKGYSKDEVDHEGYGAYGEVQQGFLGDLCTLCGSSFIPGFDFVCTLIERLTNCLQSSAGL